MFVDQNPRMEGPKDEIWEVDETLRQRAQALVQKYTDQIGHVDLQRVVFVRVEGKKAKWMGKCYPVKIPQSILPKYVLAVLQRMGALDTSKLQDEDFFDIKYIIAINSDLLSQVPKNHDAVIDILILHDLMHIDETMQKTEKHDSEDFKFILREFGVDWDLGIFNEEARLNEAMKKVDKVLTPTEVRPPPVNKL